ncbi:MAG: CocE/NonD family hydrolase [Acidimicrobiales bacterium]
MKRTTQVAGRLIGRVAVVAVVALLAACSSSKSAAPPADTTPVDGSSSAAWTRPACDRPAEPVPAAAPVPGVPSDWDVTSFDGTTIRAHWFPEASATGTAPHPTVLMGPGWGQAGDTQVDQVGFLGALNIASLHDAGFNVLTWDPRGFGRSGGTVETDSADFEGKDVQQLLDWVAAQEGVQLDGDADPRVGMVGGSYGGGIQLITAAIDCRVDSIVPIVAWHSLQTSLFKADTVKSGWSDLLFAATAGRSIDPHITSAHASGRATGTLSAEDQAWFVDRGPGDLIKDITVPTLIVQGTVDTLFTLDEGVTNYGLLDAAGVPVSMLWFCGGHGACLTDPGDETRVGTAAIAWLDRYVKGDQAVDTGARFDFVDQDGTSHKAAGWPLPAGDPITATGQGTLSLTAEGGSGPQSIPASGGLLASIVGPITPARATNAVNVAIDVTDPALIVGAPALTISYSGTVPDGDRPTRVFAQLVDDATGFVLGNQITPIEVTLDGQTHSATVPLEMVAHAATAGQHLTLQLVATTVAYAQPRLGGTITFDEVDISLPTVTGA